MGHDFIFFRSGALSTEIRKHLPVKKIAVTENSVQAIKRSGEAAGARKWLVKKKA